MRRPLILIMTYSCVFACGKDRSTPIAPTTGSAATPSTGSTVTLQASGTVVEFGAGPVAGATVSALSCSSGTSRTVSGETLTDSIGRFSLTISASLPRPSCGLGLCSARPGRAMQK